MKNKVNEKKLAAAVAAQRARLKFKREQRQLAAELARNEPKIARRCLAVALDESVNPSHSMDGYRFERGDDGIHMIRFNPMPVRNAIVGSGAMFLTADEVLAMFRFTWARLSM